MKKPFLAKSIGLKIAATLIAVSTFVLLYEAAIFDSREASGDTSLVDPTAPVTGARLQFAATAYCKGRTTASGVGVRSGVAAADPKLLPVGTVLNVSTDATKYNGIYTVMDTGPAVQGRILDLYMWSCHEALSFGRKQVQVTVLRLGWSPSASSPSLIDRLFRRREAARRTPAVENVSLPEGQVPETATPPVDVPVPDTTDLVTPAVAAAPETATPAAPVTP